MNTPAATATATTLAPLALSARAFVLLSSGAEQLLQGQDRLHCAYTIDTIAHQLAQINRYAGATRRPYSVAEHSLLCADLADEAGCPPVVQLCCLLHDAHETVVGDVSTPVKRLLGDAWTALTAPHASALRGHFGLQREFLQHRHAIHAADMQALATERRDLLAWHDGTSTAWPQLDTPGRQVAPASVNLRSRWREQQHWSEWRDAFLQRFHALATRAARQGEARACQPVQEATA